MKKRVLGKFGRLALWFSPVAIVFVGFFVVLAWLKPKNPVVVEAMTLVAGVFVLAYTNFVGRREARRWDEVQRASLGFASVNGGWGTFATMTLLMVPPVMNRLIDLVNAVVERAGHNHLPPAVANHLAVQLAFWFGIMLVILMQALASVVATIVFWRRMGARIL